MHIVWQSLYNLWKSDTISYQKPKLIIIFKFIKDIKSGTPENQTVIKHLTTWKCNETENLRNKYILLTI